MATISTSLLAELLDEKIKQDLGKIALKYMSFSPETRAALQDYAGSYLHIQYFLEQQKNYDEIIPQTTVANLNSRYKVIAKKGTHLAQHSLNSQEKKYVDELFAIVDAANLYLQQDVYEIDVLKQLLRVLNFYCYGKEPRFHAGEYAHAG